MKRLFLILPAVLFIFSAAAQGPVQGERDLKLVVRNYGDNPLINPEMLVQIKGRNEPAKPLDPWGELKLREIKPGDIVTITTRKGKVYEFPTDGHDETLYIRFKNRNKLAPARRKNDYSDKLVVGFGVNPPVDNPIVTADVGQKAAKGYRYLKDFMMENVADVRFRGDRLVVVGANRINDDYYEALVVVDGELMRSFDDANKLVHPGEVIAIDVMRKGGEATYGNRAMNGVVVITTVKSLMMQQQNEENAGQPTTHRAQAPKHEGG